jgi:hypothetical protein
MEFGGRLHFPAVLSPRKKIGKEVLLGPRVGLGPLEGRKISRSCYKSNPGPSSPFPDDFKSFSEKL